MTGACEARFSGMRVGLRDAFFGSVANALLTMGCAASADCIAGCTAGAGCASGAGCVAGAGCAAGTSCCASTPVEMAGLRHMQLAGMSLHLESRSKPTALPESALMPCRSLSLLMTHPHSPHNLQKSLWIMHQPKIGRGDCIGLGTYKVASWGMHQNPPRPNYTPIYPM